MVAWFQGYIHISPSGRISSGPQGMNFSMGCAGLLVPAFSQDYALPGHNRAYGRVWGGVPKALLTKSKGPAHIFDIFPGPHLRDFIAGTFAQQLLQLIHELIEVLKLLIYGGKTHVSHIVPCPQLRHNTFP